MRSVLLYCTNRKRCWNRFIY